MLDWDSYEAGTFPIAWKVGIVDPHWLQITKKTHLRAEAFVLPAALELTGAHLNGPSLTAVALLLHPSPGTPWAVFPRSHLVLFLTLSAMQTDSEHAV